MTQPCGRISYVAAGFPKLTETFILREVMEIERSGIPVSVYSVRPRPTGRLHADALPYLEKTHYASWFGLPHLGAFLSLLVRRPAGLMRGFGFLAANMMDQARYPSGVAKTLLATPKMVLFAHRMHREGTVHVHGHFANIPTTFAVFASRVLGITYSFTGHAWDIFVPVNQSALRRKIAGATFVATCTEFNTTVLKRFCRNDSDKRKIWRNYHGLDLTNYVATDARDDRRIVAGGSLMEKKGLNVLVDAAAILRDRGVQFHIDIVGEGPERARLESAIARNNLADRVSLVGSMVHEKLVEHMRSSAMTVLPCIATRDGEMDGVPNILIESLALAVPVVSTPISGVPELVTDGETGLLAQPHDATSLADAIEKLLRDPAGARSMGSAGRKRVEAMFDLERNVRELAGRFRDAAAPGT